MARNRRAAKRVRKDKYENIPPTMPRVTDKKSASGGPVDVSQTVADIQAIAGRHAKGRTGGSFTKLEEELHANHERANRQAKRGVVPGGNAYDPARRWPEYHD